MFSFVTIAPKILSTDNIKQRDEMKLKTAYTQLKIGKQTVIRVTQNC